MYDRQLAINYAKNWWDTRNLAFYNFDKLGGDCTNFVSQCLVFGKIEMDVSPLGWYYYSLNKRAPAFTGVEQLFNYSVSNNKNVGVRCKLTTIDQLEIGDIIQLCQRKPVFNHCVLITKIDGTPSLETIFVTCHTNDVYNKRLSDYFYTKIRFLKILN